MPDNKHSNDIENGAETIEGAADTWGTVKYHLGQLSKGIFLAGAAAATLFGLNRVFSGKNSNLDKIDSTQDVGNTVATITDTGASLATNSYSQSFSLFKNPPNNPQIITQDIPKDTEADANTPREKYTNLVNGPELTSVLISDKIKRDAPVAAFTTLKTPLAISFIVPDVTIFNQVGAVFAPIRTNATDYGFAAAWKGAGEGIKVAVRGPRGEKLGIPDRLVPDLNNPTGDESDYANPTIATIPGGAVLAWECSDGSGNGICGNAIDNQGNPSLPKSILLSTFITNDQSKPSLVSFYPQPGLGLYYLNIGAGGPELNGFPYTHIRIFNNITAPVTSSLGATTSFSLTYPGNHRATKVGNNILYSWYSSAADAGGGVMARRVSSSGGSFGSEFLLNTNTAGLQEKPRLDTYPSGGALGVYKSDNGIYAQKLDASCVKTGLEIKIPGTTSISDNPSFKILNDDTVIVVWEESGISWGIWLNADLSQRSEKFQVGKGASPSLIQLLEGNKDLVFHWEGSDDSKKGIYAKVVTPNLLPHMHNTDIPVHCFQRAEESDADCAVPNFALNLLGKAPVDVTLTLAPEVGSFNAPNNTTPYGNTVSSYDPVSGKLYIQVDDFASSEKVFDQLRVKTVSWFAGETEIQVEVTDGINVFNANRTLEVERVPRPPILYLNTLIVDQGRSVPLNESYISAHNQDPNVIEDHVFAIGQQVQSSCINKDTNQGVFNFADEQVFNETILLKHDGSRFKPSFTVTASNGVMQSATLPMPILFNEEPILGAYNLEIGFQDSVLVTPYNLNATQGGDVPTSASELRFMLYNVQNGNFLEEIDNVNYTTTNFPQSSIANEKIFAVSDGSNNPFKFDVSACDKRNVCPPPVPAQITYHPNLPPVLTTNKFIGNYKDLAFFAPESLAATHQYTPSDELLFQFRNIVRGNIVRNEEEVDSFYQVQRSEAAFAPDKSNFAPSYEVRACVPLSSQQLLCSDWEKPEVIFDKNEPPIINANKITLNYRDVVYFNSTILSATDKHTSSEKVRFDLNNINRGSVTRNGTGISNFYQDAVSEILFAPDKSNLVPSYEVRACDEEELCSEWESAELTFYKNNPPILPSATIDINRGGKAFIKLNATDDFTLDEGLSAGFSNVKHGKFVQASNYPNLVFPYTSPIEFEHDGSENAPSFDVEICDDGPLCTAKTPVAVSYKDNNQITTTTTPSEYIWGPVIGVGALVGTGVAATIAYIRHRNKKRDQDAIELQDNTDRNTRLAEGNEWARAVYVCLGEPKSVSNFDNGDGISFVTSMNKIIQKLRNDNDTSATFNAVLKLNLERGAPLIAKGIINALGLTGDQEGTMNVTLLKQKINEIVSEVMNQIKHGKNSDDVETMRANLNKELESDKVGHTKKLGK